MQVRFTLTRALWPSYDRERMSFFSFKREHTNRAELPTRLGPAILCIVLFLILLKISLANGRLNAFDGFQQGTREPAGKPTSTVSRVVTHWRTCCRALLASVVAFEERGGAAVVKIVVYIMGDASADVLCCC
jgi:hypothetical protein